MRSHHQREGDSGVRGRRGIGHGGDGVKMPAHMGGWMGWGVAFQDARVWCCEEQVSCHKGFSDSL